MEVGNRFTITIQNTRTITSGNAEGVEAWAISHIKDDVVTCELISTNMSMYSGGYYREFSVQQVTKHLNK